MPKHPRLQKRGSRFYLRARVPDDLRPVLGKREIREALDTADPREALKLVRMASVRVDALFAETRAKLRTEPVTTISEADIRHLALRWFHDYDRLVMDAGDHDPDQLDEDEADLLTPGNEAHLQGTADRILVQAHVQIDRASREYRLLCDLVTRGMLEAVRRTRRRGNHDHDTSGVGDPVFRGIAGDAPAPPALQPGANSLKLSELIKRYAADPARTKLSPKTLLKYQGHYKLIMDILGASKLVRDITRTDCRHIQEVLAALPANATKLLPGLSPEKAVEVARQKGMPPMNPTTANNVLLSLSALLTFAETEEWIDKHPGKGLMLAETGPADNEKRLPFTVPQLTMIFNAPAFAAGPRQGRFWVPLLSLWTGMRCGEACGLAAEDIQTIDGIHVIMVRPDEERGHRLKTDAARRLVTVHQELIKIGFLDFAKGRSGQLFPDLPKAATGYQSDLFSKWFGRFLDGIKITDKRLGFHSFRHTFTDALKNADVSGDVIDAICGWSTGKMRDLYGSGRRADVLAREVAKVEYQGLDLSHLYS
ncbi:MAG: site-specific integrase [Rhodospirillaceae bacterium]